MDSSPTGPIQQAGAIPFRRLDSRLEFCLVTSTRTGHWIFPKGMIDPGDSAVLTALKEAHEEAGLGGRILGDPLGQYDSERRGATLSVAVYLLEVTECAGEWLESHVRQRCWASYDEARGLLASEDLRSLLEKALQRIAERDGAS